MRIKFPYADICDLELADSLQPDLFDLPVTSKKKSASSIVSEAIEKSMGCSDLKTLVKGKKRILIVSDDIHRPTPVHLFINIIIDHLLAAGIKKENIEFMMALGTGILKEEAEKTGLTWAQSPQQAFERALQMSPQNPDIAILKNAARMLPII